jgi:hypothetical protein
MQREFVPTKECPIDEIAAYIDGELSPAHEIELEFHFSMCPSCVEQLNLQKQFLCDLDSSLKEDHPIELPDDFAKVIATRAESSVSGLRRPAERYNALFVCAAVLLFFLFATGANASRAVDGGGKAIDQAAVILGFFGHLVYSIFFGIAVILRTFAGQITFDPWAAAFLILISSSILFAISRHRTGKTSIRS